MPQCTLNHVRFAGMASCVPKARVSNLTDCNPQLRAERERLVRNIGIEYRRVAPSWQCFSDLAFDATQTLLDSLGWVREEVDALIVVTQSPDYPIPATAIILQTLMELDQLLDGLPSPVKRAFLLAQVGGQFRALEQQRGMFERLVHRHAGVDAE